MLILPLLGPPAPRYSFEWARDPLDRGRTGQVSPRVPMPGWPNLLPLLVIELAMVGFLLPFFSGSGEVCGCDFRRHLHLPFAHNVTALELGPVVRIDSRGIHIDGRLAADPESLAREPHGLMILALQHELITLRNSFALLHREALFTGLYAIVPDRDVPYWIIERVRRSAEGAGYRVPHYVVDASSWGGP